MNIYISSDRGQIGPLWWINSQPSERHRFNGRYFRLWGTCGYGLEIMHRALQPCDDRWSPLIKHRLERNSSSEEIGRAHV